MPDPEIVEALARVYGADPDTTARLAELATAIRPEYLDSRIIMQRGLNHFQERLGKIERSSALVPCLPAEHGPWDIADLHVRAGSVWLPGPYGAAGR